jgi:hypothetical protein
VSYCIPYFRNIFIFFGKEAREKGGGRAESRRQWIIVDKGEKRRM